MGSHLGGVLGRLRGRILAPLPSENASNINLSEQGNGKRVCFEELWKQVVIRSKCAQELRMQVFIPLTLFQQLWEEMAPCGLS